MHRRAQESKNVSRARVKVFPQSSAEGAVLGPPMHVGDSADSGIVDSEASAGTSLRGKRVAMLLFSFYPSDPRPRRAADALVQEGASLDLICLRDERSPRHEFVNGINVHRLAIRHRRGGKLDYLLQYSAFILTCAALLAIRSLKRRYDLVYVHNMPDILIASALIPKALGAKLLLDQHDPMPELMKTIFGLDENSIYVRLIKRLEKWSLARVHLVLTVNRACQQIFAQRSCPLEKIGVVMNTPDGEIFPLRSPSSYLSSPRTQNKPFVIMYHGSLVERNGVDLAVKALVRVRQAIPAVELRIYGKRTPYLERALQEALDLGLQRAVCYLGPKRLEDLAAEIEHCDVGIVPNRRNAFTDINTPTRIFEYLALGKPVVAPNTRGIRDYFPPGSLFFFEAGDADGLAERIEYIAAHPSESAEVAQRAQQIYLAHTWRQERQTLVALVGSLFTEQKIA